MIQYINGNIFTATTQCIVNPVNCVGVMGKGLAREFKKRFPDMFKYYKAQCDTGLLQIGQIAFYKYKTPSTGPIICLFPTKNHWRQASTLEIIEVGLRAFIKYAPEMQIKSVAFPKIGAGLGGLNFNLQVLPLMEMYLAKTDFDVKIYM